MKCVYINKTSPAHECILIITGIFIISVAITVQVTENDNSQEHACKMSATVLPGGFYLNKHWALL